MVTLAPTKELSPRDFTSIQRHDTYPFISPTNVNLSGKYYLVTGASKGIGRSIVISLAKAGATGIAALARSTVSGTTKLALAAAKEAGRASPRILELAVDMTDRRAVEGAALIVEREFGRLDVLVNNAGYLETFLPLAESDPEDWWRTWEVNVKGAYLMDRSFIPLLLKGGDKTIVTVTSAGAFASTKGASAYQSTKTAQIRLNNHIMADYGEQGLIAYCLHPGGVVTELAMGMPESMHGLLGDQPELAADTLVWLTRERREWLADRYVSANWDMEQLLAKQEKVVSWDLLKLKLRVA